MKNALQPLRGHLHSWLLRQVPPSAVRRVAPVFGAIGSDIGGFREENQDRAAVARGRDANGEGFVAAVLADGVGGLGSGADCASLAVGAAIDCIHRMAQSGAEASSWLHASVLEAHEAVRDAHLGAGGSTLVIVLATSGGGIQWTSVGDSRLYLLRNGAVTQISVDDTIAGQLGRPAGAGVDDSKLLQYVGMKGTLEFEVGSLKRQPGTTALLTTDGIHFLGSSSDLLALVAKNAHDVGTMGKRLMEIARWVGGSDNATLAAVSLDTERYESLPSDPCLDVWDAFGELRIPLVRTALTTTSVTATHAHPIPNALHETVQSVPSPLQNEVPEVPPHGKETQPEGKGEKRTQKAKRRKPRSPRSGPVPQVQLDFPGKKH